MVDDVWYSAYQPIEIDAGKSRFEFHFAGLSYLYPQSVKFKYMLEGVDDDWVDAGNRRIAYYTNISPGNYKFRVIACNNDGVWNETGATFGILLYTLFLSNMVVLYIINNCFWICWL